MMFELIIICWAIYSMYWGISALFVKKDADKSFSSLLKPGLLFVGILVVIILMMTGNDIEQLFGLDTIIFNMPPLLSAIGASMIILGLAGAISARTYLGRNWSGFVSFKKDHELVTKGPYGIVRHPIYSSIYLMLIGSLANSGSVFFLLASIIFPVVFFLRIRKEEKIMIRLFGKKYLDYMKKTKAMIPWIW